MTFPAVCFVPAMPNRYNGIAQISCSYQCNLGSPETSVKRGPEMILAEVFTLNLRSSSSALLEDQGDMNWPGSNSFPLKANARVEGEKSFQMISEGKSVAADCPDTPASP